MADAEITQKTESAIVAGLAWGLNSYV